MAYMLPNESAREYARRMASEGVALLAHALHACDNPDTPYQYGATERRRSYSDEGRKANLLVYFRSHVAFYGRPRAVLANCGRGTWDNDGSKHPAVA